MSSPTLNGSISESRFNPNFLPRLSLKSILGARIHFLKNQILH